MFGSSPEADRVLRTEVLPDLAARHFSGPSGSLEYHVVVRSRATPGPIFFNSEPQAVTPTPRASPTPLGSALPLPTFAIPGLTPFSTLAPGLTALPTTAVGGAVSFPVGCNDATFIGETKPYDGTVMVGGQVFEKGWSMQNSGTCTWDEGYSFAFKSGDQMQGENIRITQVADFTKPQHSLAFIVKMQVPSKPGQYKGFWQMRADNGEWFGSIVYVDISVGGKGTPTPTSTKKP